MNANNRTCSRTFGNVGSVFFYHNRSEGMDQRIASYTNFKSDFFYHVFKSTVNV